MTLPTTHSGLLVDPMVAETIGSLLAEPDRDPDKPER